MKSKKQNKKPVKKASNKTSPKNSDENKVKKVKKKANKGNQKKTADKKDKSKSKKVAKKSEKGKQQETKKKAVKGKAKKTAKKPKEAKQENLRKKPKKAEPKKQDKKTQERKSKSKSKSKDKEAGKTKPEKAAKSAVKSKSKKSTKKTKQSKTKKTAKKADKKVSEKQAKKSSKQPEENKPKKTAKKAEKTKPVVKEFEFFKPNSEQLLSQSERREKYYYQIYSKIQKSLELELYIQEESNVLIGVSGGVDSIVLFDILSNLAEENKFNIHVAHLNHNLRGRESDDDEKFVEQMADKYGVKYFKGNTDIKKFAEENSYSIEEAGRNKRYEFFEKVCRDHKIDYLATAHTKDDKSETFLLNLFRGSGLNGLSSIPKKRRFFGETWLIRPLLDFKKSELYEYAEKRGIKWREDSSNKELQYTRNKLRQKLIPNIEKEFNPSIIDTLARTANILTDANEFIAEYVDSLIDEIYSSRSSDRIEINFQYMNSFPQFLQSEFIRKTLKDYFSIESISQELTDRIIDLSEKEIGAEIIINEDIKVFRDRSSLVFLKGSIKAKNVNKLIQNTGSYELSGYKLNLKKIPRKNVNFEVDPNVEYFDMDFMPEILELRSWREGDLFKPLGMEGNMKVSDFLTNQKINHSEREKVLVLTDKVDIIWVVGMRISNKYAVRKSSKNILKAELLNSPIN